MYSAVFIGLVTSVVAAIPHFDAVHFLNLHQRQSNCDQGTGGSASTLVGRDATQACLDSAAIQSASTNNGLDGGEAGVSPSFTDNANFINYCLGQTLTNGTQVQGISCNGVVMGKIPADTNMVTSIILSPQPGQNLTENATFNISVQIVGLAAGSFTNPDTTYYSAPQDLDNNGYIIGHSHVTIQDLGESLTPHTPPDPKQFVFFKGLDDSGNGKGLLLAEVGGGLPAGNYRVCTMASSSNHQPVLMPVAQRGAQDDCTKFTIVAASAGNGT